MQPADLTPMASHFALLLFSIIVTVLSLYTVLMGKSESATGFFLGILTAAVGLMAFGISATLIVATITGTL